MRRFRSWGAHAWVWGQWQNSQLFFVLATGGDDEPGRREEFSPSKSFLRRLQFCGMPTFSKQPRTAYSAERRSLAARFFTSEILRRTKFSTHVRWRRQHLTPQHQWMILAPRKWWPSPKALRQVQTWQSSPRSHVRGLQRRIWSSRAPSARIAVELASSTAANAPSHCGI